MHGKRENHPNAKLLILLVMTLAYRATSIMLQTSIPLYARYVLHGSDFVVSLIAGVASFMPIISLVYITVRGVNLNRGLPLTLSLMAVSLPMFLLAHNSIGLLAVSSFVYLWTGPASVLLLTSVVLVSSQDKRERNVILFTAVLSMSLAFSPLFQSAMLRLTSDNLAYSMALYLPFMAIPLLFFPFARPESDLTVRTGFDLSFLRNKEYLLGVLSSEIFSIPFAIILTFGGIFSRNELGADYATIETLFTFFFMVSLAVRLALIRIRFKVSKVKLVVLMVCTTTVGLAMISSSYQLGELMVGFLLLGCSHGLYYPTASNFIAGSTPWPKLTSANSVWIVVDTLVGSSSIPIMGWFVELFGLRVAFLLVEVPVLALGMAFLKLALPRRGMGGP